jgi:acetate kinase
MRDLLSREVADIRAAEAVALFCYQAKKWVGAFAAALGGLDTLVFSLALDNGAPRLGPESVKAWSSSASNCTTRVTPRMRP